MTTIFRDGDIPALLEDFGVPVQVGAVVSKGLFDENDTVIVDDNGKAAVLGRVMTITVQSSRFPAVKIDDAIKVDGAQFYVRDRAKEGDAALAKFILSTTRSVR